MSDKNFSVNCSGRLLALRQPLPMLERPFRRPSSGNNDTGSLDKDIITIVHVTYDLK